VPRIFGFLLGTGSGSSGVAGDFFKTFVTDLGSNVIATTSDDTITFTSSDGFALITGDSAFKTIDFTGGTLFLYDRSGQFSTRFSEIVTATTIISALDQIFEFTSVNPSVSFSISPNTAREKGNTLGSLALQATTTRGQNPQSNITSVVFKRGASTIHTVPTPNPTGGLETYTETTPITDTQAFSVEIADASARTASASATLQFLYPILTCVGAAGLTGTQIYTAATAQTGKIISSTTSRNVTYTTSSQVAYFAYLSSYTAVVTIYDQNDFDVTSDWTLSTKSVVGLDGSSQTYSVWEFNNLTSTTQEYRFRNT
jgi:hypothetical protein